MCGADDGAGAHAGERPCDKDASKVATLHTCAAWSGEDARTKDMHIRVCLSLAVWRRRGSSYTCVARVCLGYGIRGLAHIGVK